MSVTGGVGLGAESAGNGAASRPATTHVGGAHQLLYEDSFSDGLKQWTVELESGGSVVAERGRLAIDVPGGCTVWFAKELAGPVCIEYDATVISAGGPNDRVSDLNCFWMAQDPRTPNAFFARPRSGRFADYNELLTYYVGLGGNSNTTTRFRRYIGHPVQRPMRPEDDLNAPEFLIKPNVSQRIRLIAQDGKVQFWRDGRLIFNFDDAAPYRKGYFGFRTVANHMEVRNFRVYSLR